MGLLSIQSVGLAIMAPSIQDSKKATKIIRTSLRFSSYKTALTFNPSILLETQYVVPLKKWQYLSGANFFSFVSKKAGK